MLPLPPDTPRLRTYIIKQTNDKNTVSNSKSFFAYRNRNIIIFNTCIHNTINYILNIYINGPYVTYGIIIFQNRTEIINTV